MGILHGNYRVEIYIHVLDLTRNSREKCNFRSPAGIKPAAVRFESFCFVDKNTMYLVKLSNGSYKTTVIPKKISSNNTLLYFEWISIRLQQIVKCKQLIYQLKCTVIEFKTSDCVELNDLANSPDDKKNTITSCYQIQ
jgi:hypothetical protein